MIPHLSKLKNISSIIDYTQYHSLFKNCQMRMIPTIYDENNPYYNTVNNEYFMLLYSETAPTNNTTALHHLLLNAGLTSTEVSSLGGYLIYVLKVSDEGISYVDSIRNYIATDNQHIMTFDLRTKTDLIMEGLNIVGIRTKINRSDLHNYVYNFGNVFRIEVDYDINFEQTTHMVNKYYKFPESYRSLNAITRYENVFFPYNSTSYNYETFRLYTSTNINYYQSLQSIVYSEDDFLTKNVVFIVERKYFNQIITNHENERDILIPYKNMVKQTSMEIDLIKSGIKTTYIKNGITSIQQIKDNIFQVVKNYILYECNFNQVTADFYNFKELENLNTYVGGKLRHNEEVIKIGSKILSEDYVAQYVFSSADSYLDTTKLQTSYTNDMIQYPNYGQNQVFRDPKAKGNWNFFIPSIYTFKNFIVLPKKLMILPTDINEELWIKKVSTAENVDNVNVYISSKKEDFMVKINDRSDVILLENDSRIISESGNNVIYEVSSNIGFVADPSDTLLIEVTNNVADIGGGLKNINLDSTNSIMFKLDGYEYDQNQTNIKFEMNLDIEEIKNYIFNENKFIKFINPLNSYYISQNGYTFNNINDLKTNFFNILANEFEYDEIKLNDFTNTNVNYIDDIIAIQNTINKKLTAIYKDNNFLDVDYNFISLNKNFSTSTDHTNQISEFKINYFIDEDGTVYNENAINYKLYNINNESAKTFKIVCTIVPDFVLNKKNNAILQAIYEMVDLGDIGSSYTKSINNESLNITTSETENINVNLIDSTTISITEDTPDSSVYSSDVKINNFYINNDELVNIDIDISNFSKNVNIHNEDVFSSMKYNDFIDLYISSRDTTTALHFDIIGKTFNKYSLLLPLKEKFITFGNLPKKCKSQISTWYDYNEQNQENQFYGYSNDNHFYNIMEQNSTRYLLPRQVSHASFSPPDKDNMGSFAYGIKMYDYDSVKYSTSQSIDVQPANREGHTLICTMPLDYLNNIKTQTIFNNGGFYTGLYGFNYGGFITYENSEIKSGISIRPGFCDISYCDLNNRFIFNKKNINGFNVSRFYNQEDDSTNSIINYHNLCFVLNKDADKETHSMERTYFDTTDGTGLDNVYDRIAYSSYVSNGATTVDYYNFGKPMLNAKYISKTFVNYMVPVAGYVNSPISGPKFLNIIDFDYSLTDEELLYLNTNMYNILTLLYTEKRKCVSGLDSSYKKFKYNYILAGTYIYNINRSNINIKLHKKYNSLFIYVNNIFVDEVIVDTDLKITSLCTYGNSYNCDKKITFYKNNNVITKKSGFWC